MFAPVVKLVVDAEAKRKIGLFRRCTDEDTFRAAFGDMELGFVAAGKKAGRFQNNIHTEIFPRQIPGIAFLEDLNLMAANDDVLGIEADLAVELAVDRVPFQKMRDGLRVRQIVDRGDTFDVALFHRAKDVATDSAEAVDTVGSHK